MYSKNLKRKIRAQEIVLFGGSLEVPKPSFGYWGEGISHQRTTLGIVSEPFISNSSGKPLFKIIFDYENKILKHVLISDSDE